MEGVNIWTLSPWNISRLQAGDKLFFMLKAPIRKTGGYSAFAGYRNLSLEKAWTEFGYRNGCESKSDFKNRLRKYKKCEIDPTTY